MVWLGFGGRVTTLIAPALLPMLAGCLQGSRPADDGGVAHGADASAGKIQVPGAVPLENPEVDAGLGEYHNDGGALEPDQSQAPPGEPTGGKGGDPAPDQEPPMLVELLPSACAQGLWVRQPIRLRFSEPLDPGSLTRGVLLESTAGAVEFEFELSDDGAGLLIEIANPPPTPTQLTLSLTSDLRDLAGNGMEPTSTSWHLPLWHQSTVDAVAERPPRLAGGQQATLLMWEEARDSMTSLRAAESTETGWRLLDSLPAESDARLSDLVVDHQGRPIVAWRQQQSPAVARVARRDEAGWQPLDAGLSAELIATAETFPQLAIDEHGAPVLAWVGADGIELRRWSQSGTWETPVSTWRAADPLRTIRSIDLAWLGSGPVLAVTTESGGTRDAHVYRWEDQWRPLGGALDHSGQDDVGSIALSTGGSDSLHVVWIEQVDTSSLLYGSRWSTADPRWERLGAALNVRLGSTATHPGLQVNDAGEPLVSWREEWQGQRSTYVARWHESRWQVLGGSVTSGLGATSAVSVGGHGEPIIATTQPEANVISVLRYNQSPHPPFGLAARKSVPCSLPRDSDEEFPRRLSETGCYADLSTQTIAEGWIDYEINAPLWSDGARKRRFISVPEDTTIEFTTTDAWKLPVGALLAKEFWLQGDASDPGTRFIIETRLLVKRCEPGACRAAWQGYSYQWNAAGDDAMLLDNDTDTLHVDWSVQGGTHTHGYPGRSECTRCHALAAGGSLGLRTSQLNRNHHYPDGVDNQLRALSNVGLFGDSFSPEDLRGQARLPTPTDPAFGIEQRTRGYFDVNCSHCHRPGARWPVVDFRFEAPLVADDGSGMVGNICNVVVPGDAEASLLYQKDLARPGMLPDGFTGDPMPPIGTLLPDHGQLAVTKAWIDSMISCP